MPDQALLVQTLVELADSLVDDFDVVDMLTMLSDRCVQILDVAAAGVMLVAPSGVLQVIASSSETMRVLELFQLQSDEGPCLDAYETGEAVVDVDLAAAATRWPRFALRAASEGFRSAHSLPLRLRGRRLGALNLLRFESGPLHGDDVLAAQGLADIASIAIIQHQVALDAQTLNNQLTAALNSRVIIEQAKGRISEAAGLDMDQAFAVLRNHARNHNLLLAELAAHVAGGAVDPHALDPLPPPAPPQVSASPPVEHERGPFESKP